MDLEQQLREALAPCEPGPEPEAAVMARISSVVRRKPRVILFSTMLAVAVAAAMLTMQLRDTSAPATRGPAPAPEVTAELIAQSPVQVTAPAPGPVEEKRAPKEAATATSFTVRVLPLQDRTTDVAAKAATESFHARLLDELRAVPALTLTAPGAPADYELTITGRGPVAVGKFEVSIAAGSNTPYGMMNGSISAMIGAIPPGCTSPAQPVDLPCTDPASLAASAVYSLRTKTFPPDPALKQHLQAQLVDRKLDASERFKALMDLGGLRRPSPGDRTRGPMDSAAVRGAINLAADASDPALRAQIWYALRGVRDPDLVQPLVASLQGDPDGEVRLQVLAVLAADFPVDARVRPALETAAREDARPLVRALAQRNLTGDGAWKQYMVASLKDKSRPITERMEAFMYYMYKPGPGGTSFTAGAGNGKLVDQQLVQALAQALPQAIALPEVKIVIGQLTYDLDRIDAQLTINLMLDSLAQSTEPGARTTFVTLLSRRSGDARVRAALEKISSNDEDPKLRELAANALRAAVPVAP